MAPSSVHNLEGGPNKSDLSDHNSPTIAAFPPSSSPATTTANARPRSTIIVHRKSPLLAATPPAVTRALAFSHPFILPLNQVVGLLTWTSGDQWESFLVLAGFWAATLYGDQAIRYAGPVLVVVILILAMYSRRYSPLSSRSWTDEQLNKDESASTNESKHQKSLDEILDTMNSFTSRCNILLEPFMQLTDFLSTQRSATSATTRPALTSLFIRILLVTPVWVGLSTPFLNLLTTRRVVLIVGTTVLSWHSRPVRVSRTILWRSKSIRSIMSILTSLDFDTLGIKDGNKDRKSRPPPLPPRNKSQQVMANALASNLQAESSGVKFTFVVFENQRRWLGLGWTSSLLAYERAAWTDEHLNSSDSKEDFCLPSVDNGTAQWRWVKNSEWQVEGVGKGKGSSASDGWIYYDNKWQDGRRGVDGWGRYTRRRKWYRDAELVELSSGEANSHNTTETSGPPTSGPAPPPRPATPSSLPVTAKDSGDGNQTRRRGFFRRSSRTSTPTGSEFSASSTLRNTEDEDAPHMPPSSQHRNEDWEIGDDVKMGLG